VQRFGGFVAKYMGDGVLIYFGYPKPTRVGIATGLVVVGDLIGSGASQEQAIVGETPNLAARLQGVAEPNSVVIAESTRKLVGNLFEFEDLGPQEFKGAAEPVQAWAALRSTSVESRFEALHASGLTEIVGREEELEILLRRWSKAKTGEGQVVLLSGEPGIGKSRLTAALLERLASEPHTRLRYFCSPQHTDSALYPVISQMGRAEHMWESELDRIEGELRRMQGASASDVEACFAQAIARSHQQCATSLELRAALSLARLWRDQGKVQQARELLAPVYGWFTEGFDTRDLKEAKALLDQLT